MTALLHLRNVTSGYGAVRVINGLDLRVPEGAVVVLLGANGAGKTTTLRTIAGQLPVWSGSIELDGRRIDGQRAYDICRRGILLVPEGRGVFPALSVRENLEIAVRANRATPGTRRDDLEQLLERLPRLRERLGQLAGTLSGGEQQMLALARGLLARPRVLMIDELSLGLAPLVIEELYSTVAELKAMRQTILLVEQYRTHALAIADLCYVLDKGHTAFVGDPGELSRSEVLAGVYLGA